MSVLIKGMEMPTSCFACPFRKKVDPENIMCIVTREVFEETFAGTIQTRNRGNCPLISIPPHGRLIDADMFQRRMYERNFDGRMSENWLALVNLFLAKAPTIIPAEEAE